MYTEVEVRKPPDNSWEPVLFSPVRLGGNRLHPLSHLTRPECSNLDVKIIQDTRSSKRKRCGITWVDRSQGALMRAIQPVVLGMESRAHTGSASTLPLSCIPPSLLPRVPKGRGGEGNGGRKGAAQAETPDFTRVIKQGTGVLRIFGEDPQGYLGCPL